MAKKKLTLANPLLDGTEAPRDPYARERKDVPAEALESQRRWRAIPADDAILVRQADPKVMFGEHIIIPDTAKEAPQYGHVLAVGPGGIDMTGNRIPMPCKVGDVVLFGKFAGAEVELDHTVGVVLLLRHRDILSTLVEVTDDASIDSGPNGGAASSGADVPVSGSDS